MTSASPRALESDERRVLRIWARDAVLFEKDANGRERLTEDGKARLDSAMATFVQYPRTSPFVVEGYATEITADARFLLSRWRAQLESHHWQSDTPHACAGTG